MHCGALQCVAVCRRVLQCVAVSVGCNLFCCCCSALRCVAVHCRVLQYVKCCSTLQCVAVRCSALQCVANMSPLLYVYKHTATHCNTLQHTTYACRHCCTCTNTLQHTATRCNTLHMHVAFVVRVHTHCNTLQHTTYACRLCCTCTHTISFRSTRSNRWYNLHTKKPSFEPTITKPKKGPSYRHAYYVCARAHGCTSNMIRD